LRDYHHFQSQSNHHHPPTNRFQQSVHMLRAIPLSDETSSSSRKRKAVARSREAARKTRLLNVLMALIGGLLAVSLQAVYDKSEEVYLHGAVSPTVLICIQLLACTFWGLLIWYIYGTLSSEDDARAEVELMHAQMSQVLQTTGQLAELVQSLMTQQCATTEAITTATIGTLRL
jgi:hypothetical protein